MVLECNPAHFSDSKAHQAFVLRCKRCLARQSCTESCDTSHSLSSCSIRVRQLLNLNIPVRLVPRNVTLTRPDCNFIIFFGLPGSCCMLCICIQMPDLQGSLHGFKHFGLELCLVVSINWPGIHWGADPMIQEDGHEGRCNDHDPGHGLFQRLVMVSDEDDVLVANSEFWKWCKNIQSDELRLFT